jgi:hypothetical protein
MRNAAIGLLATALVLGFFASGLSNGRSGDSTNALAEEVARLRYANTLLQTKVDGYSRRAQTYKDRIQSLKEDRKKLSECRSAAAARVGEDAPPPPSPAAAANGVASEAFAEQLLEAHSRWDWRAIVTEMLQPWPRVELAQLETAVAACNDNGTMYCQRMQVRGGNLYLTDYRAIFFDRHYAPARVLPIMETLRRHPTLPDMDLVVAGNDEPRVPSMPGDRWSWTRTCGRWPGANQVGGSNGKPGPGSGKMPPAIFASTNNRAVFDLPWIDFAWFFPRRPHKLRTPPWSKLHGSLLEAGRSVQWADKTELAIHTGNVGSPHRKILCGVAQSNPDTVLVNELFIGDHAKIRKTCAELGLHKKGGFQQHKCFMTFQQQCGYKYLINSASIGYANKFKSLLLCGSVVIYVREGMRHKEFYEYGLLPGVHCASRPPPPMTLPASASARLLTATGPLRLKPLASSHPPSHRRRCRGQGPGHTGHGALAAQERCVCKSGSARRASAHVDARCRRSNRFYGRGVSAVRVEAGICAQGAAGRGTRRL